MRKVCVITGGGSGIGLATANALGTININDAFFEVMHDGSCIIDTFSMSAYLTPQLIMPKQCYKLSRIDLNKFMTKKVTLLIERQYDSIYDVCAKANELLRFEKAM